MLGPNVCVQVRWGFWKDRIGFVVDKVPFLPIYKVLFTLGNDKQGTWLCYVGDTVRHVGIWNLVWGQALEKKHDVAARMADEITHERYKRQNDEAAKQIEEQVAKRLRALSPEDLTQELRERGIAAGRAVGIDVEVVESEEKP